jgi:hypothetical protein
MRIHREFGEVSVNASADPRECPYVGLDPFEAAHTAYFFGRRRESKIIVDHVCARPVTILYGSSGVGKTSILNVGLPAALVHRRGWMIAVLRDWQDPDSLERRAVEAVLTALPSPPHHPLHHFGLAPLIAWATRSTGRRLVLVFDQFEEYFLYRDRNRMRALEVAMGDMIVRGDLPLHLLVSLRDDALYRLDELRAYVPGILDTTIKLGHLDDASVEEAITGPVDRYNGEYRKGDHPVTVENQLVRTLILQLKETGREHSRAANADEQPIELSYLQLALTKLWAAEGGAQVTALREATLTDDNKLGGVRRIIRDHVNSVMRGLSIEDQTLCAKLFDRLVTGIGSKVAYPTEGLAAPDVAGPNVSQERVEAVLGKLTPKQSRILKPVTTGGMPGFEIFHDVLGLPVLEWRRRFQAEVRRREEHAKAEAHRLAERAEAEKRLAAERAEAEKRLALEHAEKELAVERAARLAQRRARKILAAVVGAFVLVMAVAGWHFALQSGIDRLTQFAEVDTQPEFRLRLLASLAALDKARRFWPLTGDSRVLEVLHEKLISSPRDGGTYTAFGVSADGTHIAWVDEQQRHIVVCPLAATEICSFSTGGSGRSDKPYWVPLPAASSRVSGSRKLRSSFTRVAVGFFGEGHEPVYYREGILYYRRDGDWGLVDVNTLVRGLDDLSGIASVDFINGVMRVSVSDWPSNKMTVTLVKSQADTEPPFASSDTRKVEWPPSEGPVDNAPPIFSSEANYAYIERQAAASDTDGSEPAESVNPGSKLVLVLGAAGGEVPLPLDDPHQTSSPLPAAAPARGVIGFSEDGRYLGARHDGFVRVFDVAQADQNAKGLTFGWDRSYSPPRRGRGARWYAPPLGVLAGDNGGKWHFAWDSDPGLDVLSGLPGQALSRSQRPNLLLAGMESVQRIEFSRDGRFLFAHAFVPGAGARMVYARVWDLTKAWDATITKAIHNQPLLHELVCHIAAIEPDGDQFTNNELKTEIGEKWEQPCRAPLEERTHPF